MFHTLITTSPMQGLVNHYDMKNIQMKNVNIITLNYFPKNGQLAFCFNDEGIVSHSMLYQNFSFPLEYCLWISVPSYVWAKVSIPVQTSLSENLFTRTVYSMY